MKTGNVWRMRCVKLPLRLSGSCRQNGMSLIVCLLMLVVILLLGTSAVRIALQEEKASRSDRDRQVAFEAAEAALRDAELDIETSQRAHLFADGRSDGFTDGCSNGAGSNSLGLCLHAPAGGIPIWRSVDLANAGGQAQSVPYGQFTGHSLQTGEGLLPAALPRYIIELIPFGEQAKLAPGENAIYLYRITAIGFGLRDATRIVLQTFYRKAGDESRKSSIPSGRLSWREIPNWQELHDAIEKG